MNCPFNKTNMAFSNKSNTSSFFDKLNIKKSNERDLDNLKKYMGNTEDVLETPIYDFEIIEDSPTQRTKLNPVNRSVNRSCPCDEKKIKDK